MAFRTLISTETLAAHLADPTFVIVDCRFKLDDVDWGKRAYDSAHIPGASYAHLDRDLSGPKTGTNGRHPLPDPQRLATTLGHMGIARGNQVVAYDQDTGSYASRLWWLLRWLGHDEVAVLDGGFKKWNAEGRATATTSDARPARDFRAALRPDMAVSARDVATLIDTKEWQLVDARAPERFAGITEPIDRVAGHIPSAVDHPFQQNLNDAGLFRSPDELRAALSRATRGTASDHVVCYCGSGVTACHNLLAFEHAGLPGAKLYAGSWSEWSSDPSRPIEKGPGT